MECCRSHDAAEQHHRQVQCRRDLGDVVNAQEGKTRAKESMDEKEVMVVEQKKPRGRDRNELWRAVQRSDVANVAVYELGEECLEMQPVTDRRSCTSPRVQTGIGAALLRGVLGWNGPESGTVRYLALWARRTLDGRQLSDGHSLVDARGHIFASRHGVDGRFFWRIFATSNGCTKDAALGLTGANDLAWPPASLHYQDSIRRGTSWPGQARGVLIWPSGC